jgi:hypothetical protein
MRKKQALPVFPMGVYNLLEPEESGVVSEESGAPFNHLVYEVEQINVNLFLCTRVTDREVGALLEALLTAGVPLPVEPLYSATF